MTLKIYIFHKALIKNTPIPTNSNWQSPPAAAIEFLNKIREVISIAKYKMAAKRFQPSLIMIPEERGNGPQTNGGADSETYYAQNAMRRASSVNTPSMSHCKSSASSSCIGCPGCAEVAASSHSHTNNNNNNNSTTNSKSDCRNCGDKRNSIRKWLEDVSDNVSHRERPPLTEQDGEHNILDKSGESADSTTVDRNASGSGSDSSGTLKASSVKSVKRRQAPAPPTLTPNSTLPTPAKIISHYLKPQDKDLLEVNNNHHIRTTFNKNIAQSFSEPSKIYDKMELYNQLAKGSTGSGQLFNNPQFQHGSPPLSHRSSHRSGVQKQQAKTAHQVHDQFTTTQPAQNHHQRDYEVMQSLKQQMPDMIYEAMAKDYTKRKNNHYNGAVTAVVVPQPDYDDSTLSKKYEDVPPYVQVPTPDYNTYGRTSKNNPQPDSPIYTRKSPHHLIVDYETDSLERSTKFSRGSVSPPMTGQQSNSSDLSSQPSPSLSNALPLEEEVEVRHTVYDRVEGFRKDGVDFVTSPRISFSNVLAPTKEPRIKYNTPSQGSMTIEVEHSPSEYELSTDSEQFEPDTLDRKTKKMQQSQSESAAKNVNVNLWSQHLLKANNFLNETDEPNLRYSSLENITSLPDMNLSVDQSQTNTNGSSQLILRSSGSFKSNSLSNFASANTTTSNSSGNTNDSRLQKNFNSLREIYEAKNLKNLHSNTNNNNVAVDSKSKPQIQNKPQQQQYQQKQRMLANEKEKGRLLTLEARHSRRQRQTNGVTTLKKPAPPDVVPSAGGTNSIYDHPKQLVSPYELISSPIALSKNLSGWNTTGDHHDYITMRNQHPQTQTNGNTLSSTTSSSSTNSGESTAITGVSDTHRNSSDKGSVERKSTIGSSKNSTTSSSRKYSQVQKKQSQSSTTPAEPQHQPMEILKNFMSLGEVRNAHHLLDTSDISDFSNTSTLKSGSTNFYYKRNGDGSSPQTEPRSGEDMDKIEIVSSRSLSIHNVPISHSNGDDDEAPSALMQELTSHQNNMTLPATKVFRVEVNPSTHGMQIALGLKDRVRKSKDLKYAWKRFVNIATSKFQGNGSGGSNSVGKSGSLDALDKSSVLSDGDEGISSLHDDSMTVLDQPRSKGAAQQIHVSRTPSVSSDVSVRRPVRCDPDSGYMSADSNESKMNSKKLYERFNFRATSSKSGRGNQLPVDNTEVDFAQKNMNRMQEIKETSQEQERSHSRSSSLNQSGEDSHQPTQKPALPHHKPSVTGFIPKRKPPPPVPQKPNRQQLLQQSKVAAAIEPIEVNVFSSDDDEKFSSSGGELESETDDEELSMDEMCESGAESVETNSVFFKNVRKASGANNNQSSGENSGYTHGSSKKS